MQLGEQSNFTTRKLVLHYRHLLACLPVDQKCEEVCDPCAVQKCEAVCDSRNLNKKMEVLLAYLVLLLGCSFVLLVQSAALLVQLYSL